MGKKSGFVFRTITLALIVFAIGFIVQPVYTEAVSRMRLSDSSLSLRVGKKKKLTLKNKKGKKVAWKSSDKKVATVSKSGLVRAIKAGKTTVTATVKKGKKKVKFRCAVTVMKKSGQTAKDTSSSSGDSTKKQDTAGIATGSYGLEVDTTDLSQETVYQRMMALQAIYPEKTPWTNDNSYNWAGINPNDNRVPTGGAGCVGFNFILSDAAFGTLPARYVEISEITGSDVRVGDIIRYVPKQGQGQEHSVSVLEVKEDSFVVAEGNYNQSVHWGRIVRFDEVFGRTGTGICLLTRYPQA